MTCGGNTVFSDSKMKKTTNALRMKHIAIESASVLLYDMTQFEHMYRCNIDKPYFAQRETVAEGGSFISDYTK